MSLSGFTVAGLIQSGLMAKLIEFLTNTQFATTVLALVCLLVVFVSSETRNPQHYHPAEMFVVSMSVVLMIVHAALTEVQSVVTTHQPWGGVALLVPWLVAGVILAR